MSEFNISELSDSGLDMLHQGVKTAMEKDALTPEGEPKPFGVRATPDWKRWSDALEEELKKRGLSFCPIPW